MIIAKIRSDEELNCFVVYTEDVEVYQTLRQRPELIKERYYNDSLLQREKELTWVSADLYFPQYLRHTIVDQINQMRPYGRKGRRKLP